MSAQINLYHPRFLKQRDLLTLGNVVLATVTCYVALAAAGGWAWQDAARRGAAAATAEAQLKSAKDQVEAATKAATARKPNAQLVAELESAEGLLRRRGDIARLLESGAIGNTGGFAEYLRGFARQTPQGLWLAGFTIGSGGNDMEIRGRMLNPAALPDYIHRLGTEAAFQGRSFAALSMNRGDPTPAAAVPSAPTSAAGPIDFVLMPRLVEAKEAKR